jgi:hypothetical protein
MTGAYDGLSFCVMSDEGWEKDFMHAELMDGLDLMDKTTGAGQPEEHRIPVDPSAHEAVFKNQH